MIENFFPGSPCANKHEKGREAYFVKVPLTLMWTSDCLFGARVTIKTGYTSLCFCFPDTQPPSVHTIAHGQGASHGAFVFSFDCNEINCLFECLIQQPNTRQALTFSPCSGGYTAMLPVSGGQPNLSVRAVDLAGNVGQPSVYSFTVPGKSEKIRLDRASQADALNKNEF